MNNQQFKKVSFQLDYADKPIRRRDWRGMVWTIAVIAAFLGCVALEYAVMGSEYGL